MNPERLCYSCTKVAQLSGLRVCTFIAEANSIAELVHLGVMTPADAHFKIAAARLRYERDFGCPNINYDPNYPGKEKL